MTDYRDLDPSLPDIGWLRGLPRAVTPEAARQVHASTDAAALGLMAGALRSYAGPAGSVPILSALAVVCVLMDWQPYANIALGGAAAGAWVVIEVRRRCVQWLGVVESRIAVLGGPGAA